MRTLWNPPDRAALVERLGRLTAEAPARWGRFTAPRMLAHVNDALRMSIGELGTSVKRTPLRFPVVKQVAVYFAPWPHDEGAIRNAAQALAQAEGDAALFKALVRAQILPLLDADQRQKLATFESGAHGRWKGHGPAASE